MAFSQIVCRTAKAQPGSSGANQYAIEERGAKSPKALRHIVPLCAPYQLATVACSPGKGRLA